MEEALFLTFNIDLGFLEGRVVGVCQATGARVTAVADAGVWNPDPRAATAIGTRYHVGRAFMPGAFHPKVIVLSGPDACFLAIGSGNLTLGGWQYNSEIWTMFTARNGEAPAILDPVARWLECLPEHITVDDLSRDAMLRTAHSIRHYVEASTVVDTGHTFLSSTTDSILDQITGTDVDELDLYAPFHDPNSAAIDNLIHRLNPKRVRILVQPGLTVMESDALRTVINRHAMPVTVMADPSRRYRHGKLIEWSQDGQRWALTGSANLSIAALESTIGTGGNCEAGVITRVPTTLMSEGVEISTRDLRTFRITSSATDREHASGPQLLSATVVDSGIEVVLASASRLDLSVQLSRQRADLSDWEDIGELPAGVDTNVFTVVADSGSRLRLQYLDNNGTDRYSQLVFLSNPALVRRQPMNGSARAAKENRNPLDIWANHQDLLRLVTQDFPALDRDVKNTSKITIPKEVGDEPDMEQRKRKTIDPWLWLMDESAAHHGTPLTAFALGRGADILKEQTAPAWVDRTADDDTPGLETDTAEDPIADPTSRDRSDTARPPVDQSDDAKAVKAAQIRWCRQSSQRCPRLPTISQLLVLRIILGFATRGVWDENDTEPLTIVDSILDSLVEAADRTPPPPPQLRTSIASLAAVALTVLHERVDPSVHDERTIIYRRARSRVEPLLVDTDADTIAEYCLYLHNSNGFPLRPGHVVRTISAILTHDELSDAIAATEADGHDVTRVGENLVRIDGTFGTAQMPALRFIAAAQSAALVGAWAINPAGDWALAIWRKPDLIVARSTAHQPIWQHDVLSDRVPPSAFLQIRAEDSGGFRRPHRQRDGTFTEAQRLLTALGLSSPQPPSDLTSLTAESTR